MDAHTRTFIMAHSRKGASKPKPLRVPRPEDAVKKPKRNATGEEMAAMVKRLGGAKVASSNGN